MRLSLDTPSDQVILRALREGELRQAADTLVLIYAGVVYRACRLASSEASTAEDLAYETYTAIFGDLSKLHGSVSLKNRLLSEAQERTALVLLPGVSLHRRESSVLDLDVQGAPVDREALRRAVDELVPRHRALLGVAFGFALPTFPFAAAEVPELKEALGQLVASIPQEAAPSLKEVAMRLGDLHWRVPERLQRRLEVLCSSLGGVS
ncbi:MAG: sigma-70 family RNA polymerase sigma factor [Deltaproteobacteria bacterium]|nr:sigma-70 family RNA polymerase sigma factor [Deltaproteobacteria bacterium]